MERLFKLFDPEVARELLGDRELALVFYSTFDPYDPDIDPTFNSDWVKSTAIPRERAHLERSRRGLEQARRWVVDP